MTATKIIIVEDEYLTIELIRECLSGRGYDVTAAVNNGNDALRAIEVHAPDLILMDINIKGDMDGISLTKMINERFGIPVIYLTAFADGKTIKRAKLTEAYGYIIKPFGEMELLSGIEIALSKHAVDVRLKVSEERYRMLFESSRDAIMILEPPSWKFTSGNAAAIRMFGVSNEEEFISYEPWALSPDRQPDGRSSVEKAGEMIETAVREGSNFFEWTHRRIGGDDFPATVLLTRMEYAGKTMVQATVRDITERKMMETALQESDKRYRAIFDGSLNLIYIHDFSGKFIDANTATLALLGYSREDMPSLSFFDIVSEDQLKKATEQTAKILDTGGQSGIMEFQLRSKNGELKYIETSASLIFKDGNPHAILGIAQDVTDRRRYIGELKTAQEDTTNLLNSLTSIIIGVSIHDDVTHWNPAAESAFGIPSSKAVGTKLTQLVIDWDWTLIYEGITQTIVDDSPKRLEDMPYSRPDGTKRLFGITINPIKDGHDRFKGFIIQASDITDRRIMEQQLQQSGKMAVIGEIATGIAHELNQPLNVIKIAAQFLLDGISGKYATEEFIVERANKIVAQVDRATKIINHLREFGHKSDLDFKEIDPNLPVRKAFDMLGEQLDIRSISTKLELGENLPPVYGDEAGLEQVYINFIVNSRDALEDMKNSLHEKIIHVRSYFDSDNRSVCIEFGDTGPGIPSGVIDRVFDPFFTTKEVGKGTGLGLSISYGIIKSHQGAIDVSSSGSGAVFTVTLPVKGIVTEEKH